MELSGGYGLSRQICKQERGQGPFLSRHLISGKLWDYGECGLSWLPFLRRSGFLHRGLDERNICLQYRMLTGPHPSLGSRPRKCISRLKPPAWSSGHLPGRVWGSEPYWQLPPSPPSCLPSLVPTCFLMVLLTDALDLGHLCCLNNSLPFVPLPCPGPHGNHSTPGVGITECGAGKYFLLGE